LGEDIPMRLSRREFTRLTALSLGLGMVGLPNLSAEAAGGLLSSLDALLPLHPLLQLRALLTPNDRVVVLVQTMRLTDSGATIAAAGGGDLLESFPFVKAHRMRLPLGILGRLARRLDVLSIAPDAPLRHHAVADPAPDPARLLTSFPRTVQASAAWQEAQTWGGIGEGVAVAVLDTGLTIGPDFDGRTRAYKINPRTNSVADLHGHGTHIAGIIKGRSADGAYVGIAPGVTLISAKIADDQGAAQTSDLLRGLQWVYDNRNGIDGSGPIKVVSLSTTAAIPESYLTSALCAAVERLWSAGVVVVCAAGNRGTDRDATWYPPANDPYVITVGATDEGGSAHAADDTLAPFSSRGRTQDGGYKPDIVAPGRRIVSTLASPSSLIARLYPDRIVDSGHIRLSGTSMAAPVVAGAVALLRAKFPKLTPDQIKWLIAAKGQGYKSPDGVPLLAVQQAALWANNPKNQIGAANKGLLPSLNIALPLGGLAFVQTYWDQTYWDQTYWDQTYWDQTYWDTDLNQD
jgi:serine protease AprX